MSEPFYAQVIEDRKSVVNTYVQALKELEELDGWNRAMIEELIFKELKVDRDSLSLDSVDMALKQLRLIDTLKDEPLLQKAQFLLEVLLIHLAIMTDNIIALKGQITEGELILAVLWCASPARVFLMDKDFKPKLPTL